MLRHVDNKIFLHPGEFHFTDQQVHLHTLLGSCISITLWHPDLKIGRMCHFKLPTNPAGPKTNVMLNGNYADDAMKMFSRDAQRYGTRLTEYQAKIFGGGNMMSADGERTHNAIGERNAAAAMQLLMQEEVNIMVAHVGEFGHRRIVFDVGTGEVWVRHVDNNGKRSASMSGLS